MNSFVRPLRLASMLAFWAGISADVQAPEKRLILHDFGGPDRLYPSFVRSRLAYLETLPVDGLAILVARNNGVDNISGSVMQPTPVSLDRIAAVLAPIAGLASPTLERNFGLVYFGPGFDIFDDAKWAVSSQNMTNFAAALNAVGAAGIFFDNENYADYADYRPGSPACDARAHSLDDCQSKMRERGGQIMRAIESAFPEIVIVFFHDAFTSDRTFFDQNPLLANVDASNELLGPFLVGFVEAKGSQATVVQGGENAGAHSFEDFDRLYQYSKRGIALDHGAPADAASRAVKGSARGFIPSSLRLRWPELVSCGAEIRSLDNIDSAGNPRGLAVTVANALRRADEYAWLYMDVPGKGDVHTTMLAPPGASPQAVKEAFVEEVWAGRTMIPHRRDTRRPGRR